MIQLIPELNVKKCSLSSPEFGHVLVVAHSEKGLSQALSPVFPAPCWCRHLGGRGWEIGGRKGEANWTVGMKEDEKRIKGKVLPFKDLRTSGRRQSPTEEGRTVYVAHYCAKAWEGTGCLRGSSNSGWFLGE